jgi:hypothetical protein
MSFPPLRGLALKAAMFLATVLLSVVAALTFTPFFAGLLSRKHAVTVSYAVHQEFVDCDYYDIGIHPENNKDSIKSMTLHLRFPGAIRSVEYGTDHTMVAGKAAIQDSFYTGPPCDIKAAIPSDLPPSIKIARTGQAKQEISIIFQNLDPSTSLMLIVGIKRGQNPRLVYSGEATYSAWNQDVPAPINVRWLNEP